jgi:hypothetical protein
MTPDEAFLALRISVLRLLARPFISKVDLKAPNFSIVEPRPRTT